MAVHNADVAMLFHRLADLLEIEEANPFRVRAYRRAAATVEDLPESVAAMVTEGRDLTELPGIGEDLAGKIREIVETGDLKALHDIEARTPASLAALMNLPGLGPKRVHDLHEALGIVSIEDLVAAASAGRLRSLPRFGARLEAKLLEAIEKRLSTEQRFKISTAEDFARGLENYLRKAPGIGEVVVAGSFRRRRETIGDLDFLAIAENGAAVIDHFVRYDEVARILSKGRTRSTVLLKAGIQVDLRVVGEESFGAALYYFTGSKAHNIAVRKLAQARGLKINEYGVYRGRRRIGGASEEEVFAAVELPYIEPELREDRGEIEAAQRGQLPRLVSLADIRGDLHSHSNASDGKNSLLEMARSAKTLGYFYLAITDHSQHIAIAHGLDARRLKAQFDEIDRLNERLEGVRLLKSAEVDILADGSLDLPKQILSRLDLTLCAIHDRFELGREEQTARIIRAMDNRYFNILAHPTGRLLGERPPYAIDMERLIAAAKERGCFLELNAYPARLDLDDVHCRMAKEAGVKIAVATDAHSALGLGAMRYGVDQARRGWLEAGDVLNTRPWPELRALLAR